MLTWTRYYSSVISIIIISSSINMGTLCTGAVVWRATYLKGLGNLGN